MHAASKACWVLACGSSVTMSHAIANYAVADHAVHLGEYNGLQGTWLAALDIKQRQTHSTMYA